MLVDLKQGLDGDLELTAGAVSGVEGLAAIAQMVRIRLSVWRGEWSPDTTQGVPYLEAVLARGVPLSSIETVFRRAVLLCPGVESIETLSVSRETDRTLLVAFRARTRFGLLRSSDFAPFRVSLTPGAPEPSRAVVSSEP